MADNTSKSTFNTKQKVIAAITVIIFCFIIYEVIGLFPSKSATTVVTPVPAHPQQMSANRPAMTASFASPGAMQPAGQPAALTTVNAITPSPKDSVDLQKQQQQQQVYLESVNQLQLLKVKREIAETNQAIASARLATETANKNMSDLLTSPAPLPQATGGMDLSKLTGGVGSTTVQTTENSPPIKPTVLDIPFSVISVSMDFNRWKAVLSYQDKLYSVSIGDTLFDGSKVASITKNGVTLVKDGRRRKISIQTSI